MSGLAVVAEAKKYLNKKSEYNCFGFIQHCYEKGAGIRVANTFSYLLVSGTGVTKNNLKLGDLIIIHWNLGIFSGNNKMILAPKVAGDRPIETKLPDSFQARRLIQK